MKFSFTAAFNLLQFSSVQFISVTQSCPTLCDPMNCSTPGLPVHHQLLEFTQTHIHRVGDAIQPSHPLLSPSPPAPNPSQHESFPMSQLFAWGDQSTGVSASVSFLPKHTQDWSLEWTGWISLHSKGLSRIFSNTTVQKHQFVSTQLSSQSNSHIHTWLLNNDHFFISSFRGSHFDSESRSSDFSVSVLKLPFCLSNVVAWY